MGWKKRVFGSVGGLLAVGGSYLGLGLDGERRYVEECEAIIETAPRTNLTQKQYPVLYAAAKEACKKLEIEMPPIHIVTHDKPYIVTTEDTAGNPIIVLTTAWLEGLNHENIRSVFGHEGLHVKVPPGKNPTKSQQEMQEELADAVSASHWGPEPLIAAVVKQAAKQEKYLSKKPLLLQVEERIAQNLFDEHEDLPNRFDRIRSVPRDNGR